MTNFLSSLITRTIETAPIVKPRPQSLYEPVTRAPQMPTVETEESVGRDPVARTPTATDGHAPAEPVETPLAPAQERVPPGEPPPAAAVHDSAPTRSTEPANRPRRSDEEAAKEDVTARRAQTRPPAPKAQPLPPTPPTVASPRPHGEEARPDAEPAAPERKPPTVKMVSERKEDVEPLIRELFVERVVAREETTPPIERVTRPSGSPSAPLRPQPTMPSSRTGHPRVRQPDDHSHDLSPSQVSPDQQPAPSRRPDSPQKPTPPPAVSSIPDRQDGKRPISTPAMALYPQTTVPALTSRRPAEKQQPSEPEPTVRVRIGRIEVRATPPPPEQTKKPRRKTPVMSLDDYLERRNGRGKPG